MKNKKGKSKYDVIYYLSNQICTEIDGQIFDFMLKTERYKYRRNRGVHITYSMNDFILY
jgi:hypothetical protein